MMNTEFIITRATARDVPKVATMVGELLTEIMTTINIQAFHFDLTETMERLSDFIKNEKYVVFVASRADDGAAGFIALYESYALYAEGAFGTIPELYVRPEYRSHALGKRLVSYAKTFGFSRGWSRLEVTTPPLPQFDKTLEFYEREGFAITGGRKLKIAL
ncbi:GNAT family N-acetyltransferase [Desulfovibrio inopinatus]|uniref:GNAT family N-acetyltransferase n=1 Tax=Desulfovibrio inopinatus TaxID=102109 RepID=UPI001B7FC53B|nr:N-acetyltransferase [Desulfovibrio inopinatus]